VIPELTDLQRVTIIIGGISTLAMFSFLVKENTFYRLFEHIFIGVAAAIGFVGAIRYFIWPELLTPLLGLDREFFPDGTAAEPYNKLNLLFLLPMAFGSLYYFILTKRYNWIAQIVIGFSLGLGGGLAFKAILNEMLPQVISSFRPLYVPGNGLETFSNIVFVITLLSVMSYFFFTFRRGEGRLVQRTSSLGRWMMMGCFGAFFGATIMARMALLVERLEFLINRWWPTIMAFF
jgi:hypothetical protein